MPFGKVLVVCGAVFMIAGVLIILFGRLNLPLGRLPGDFLFRRKNTTIYFPLATSVLLSVVLSLLLYAINRWRQ
jgi:fumarate reductase subunit D